MPIDMPDQSSWLTWSFCAADCLQRALGLLNGCQPFLNALNANGGQLSKFTIFQILQLAIQDKAADLTYATPCSCFECIVGVRPPLLPSCKAIQDAPVACIWRRNHELKPCTGQAPPDTDTAEHCHLCAQVLQCCRKLPERGEVAFSSHTCDLLPLQLHGAHFSGQLLGLTALRACWCAGLYMRQRADSHHQCAEHCSSLCQTRCAASCYARAFCFSLKRLSLCCKV